MNKMNLAGTSLVAAIPGALLGYLVLMAMINHMDSMPTVLKVAAIALFLVALMMTLFPGFVLIYHGGGKTKEETAADDNSETGTIPAAAPSEDISGDFEEDEISDESDGFDMEGDDDFDEFDDDDEFEFDEED